MFTVIYFKPSGKYYTEGRFNVPAATHMGEVCDWLRQEFAAGRAPGLSGWSGYYHAVIMPNESCPFGYPCMFPSEAD